MRFSRNVHGSSFNNVVAGLMYKRSLDWSSERVRVGGGSDGSHEGRLLNEALTAFAYRWGNAEGLKWVDLAAFDRAMGESILAGIPLMPEDKTSC